MRLPSKPAVVMLNGFRWTNSQNRTHNPGIYYNNAEADFIEISTYYHLPTISVKAGAYHLMKTHVPGFRIDNMLEDVPGGWNESLTAEQKTWFALRHNTSFFITDGVHPAGQSGHRAYAEILSHQLVKVAFGLNRRPISDFDHRFIDGVFTNATISDTSHNTSLFLPPPIIKDNYEPSAPSCYFGASLKTDVPSVVSGGFSWVDDSKEGWRTKLGWKTTTADSKIEFSLDMHSLLDPREVKPNQASAVIKLQLIYLRSYDKMGMANVTCDAGCSCQSMVLDGQWSEQLSLTVAARVDVRIPLECSGACPPADKRRCVVSATMLKTTSSGGYKFKIAGLVMMTGFVYEGDFNHPALELLAGNTWDRGDKDRSVVQKSEKFIAAK